MEEFGKVLIVIGLLVVVAGGFILLVSKLNIPLGHLPGDIVIQKKNLTCFVPLATSILVSILLTLLINLIIRLMRH